MGLRRSSVALGNAENYLDKALLNPTPLAHQVGAGILSQQGRHEEAIEEAKQAISLDPNTADSYLALAGTLSLAGRPSEALRMVKRAMRLNPYYPPSYLYGLGMAHFGMRNYRQAAESLERAMALNPDDRWSARLLLASYGHLGRKKEATGLMKNAAENWTGHDPLNIRSIAFWYPFQKASDAEDLAAGLRKADVPD
jgi:tetratricopeptide (TPR) repeat protein